MSTREIHQALTAEYTQPWQKVKNAYCGQSKAPITWVAGETGNTIRWEGNSCKVIVKSGKGARTHPCAPEEGAMLINKKACDACAKTLTKEKMMFQLYGHWHRGTLDQLKEVQRIADGQLFLYALKQGIMSLTAHVLVHLDPVIPRPEDLTRMEGRDHPHLPWHDIAKLLQARLDTGQLVVPKRAKPGLRYVFKELQSALQGR